MTMMVRAKLESRTKQMMAENIDALLAPGLRFLLQKVCRAPDAQTGDQDSGVSWPALVEEAKHQRIAGLLNQWITRQNDVPSEVKAELAAAQRENAVRALALIAESQRAWSLLQGAGINALIVKGPLLSKRYYGDYAIRHAGDVDLLVAPQQASDADRVLRQRGYTRTKPVKELSPKRLDLYLRTQHEFGYRSPQGDTLVELHWRYSDSRSLSPYAFAEIWERSTRLHVAGQELAVPCTGDVFIHLAIHGAADGWSRLKWIADLPRVLADLPPAELEPLLADTQRRGIAQPIALALALAGHETPIAGRRRKILFKRVATRLQARQGATDGTRGKMREALEGHRYKMQLVESLSGGLELAYANLIMPADFDRISLPTGLTWLMPWLAQLHRARAHLLNATN
jgi:hypothetical protein